MDHAIQALKPFYEVMLDWFVDEHKSGNYAKFSDNPYWNELKALNAAMNKLRRYLDLEPLRLSEEIRNLLAE